MRCSGCAHFRGHLLRNLLSPSIVGAHSSMVSMPEFMVSGLVWERSKYVARGDDAGNVEAAQIIQRQVHVRMLECITEEAQHGYMDVTDMSLEVSDRRRCQRQVFELACERTSSLGNALKSLDLSSSPAW